MRSDALLSFVPFGAPLSLVSGSNSFTARSNVIDLAGVGVGQAMPNIFGTQVTTFYEADAMGVGMIRPEIDCAVGTAFTTGSSATLQVALEAAPDNGSNNPGTWVILAETGLLTAAQLGAGKTIARFPWLPPFPDNEEVRFLSLLFTVSAATFTAGTIAFAIVTTVRDDQFNKYAQKNYTVA